MKYWIGVDSSTSCTGIAVIDENNKLVHYDYAYTKDRVKRADSLGDEFDIIIGWYNLLIDKIVNKIMGPTDFFEIAIEANSFGGYNTTMLLGVTIGIMHSIARNKLKNCVIKYSAVGNWRSKVLDMDPTEDLRDVKVRNQLKKYIADWAERTYNFKLPLFVNKYDGIKINDTLDLRINDISDAIGLAYCCKNGLLSDRRELKIQTRKDDQAIRSLKNNAKRYHKLVETWYKKWKQEEKILKKNNSTNKNTNTKTVLQHCKTLEYYLNELKVKNNLNSIMENWYNMINDIRKELNNEETITSQVNTSVSIKK